MIDQDIDQEQTPVTPPEDPGYTNEDLKKESLHDIAANTEAPKEPEVKEEKPVEPPIEDKKEETPANVPDSKVIAEEAAQAVLDKQKEAEKVEEPVVADTKTEYQKIVDDFAAEKGRTPTWDELAEKIEERTIAKIDERQEAARKAQEAEQATRQAQVDAENKRINSFVDDELSDLYANGKLTPVKDPKNESDQGVVERKALFAAWKDVNDKRRAEGKPEIISATRIYEYYYKKPNAQPRGADAPIVGNRGSSSTPQDEKSYTYDEIHRKPFSFFGKK